MLTLGIDVLTLGTVGVICVLIVYGVCVDRTSEEDGMCAVIASASTAAVLLVSYVIMARVLDNIVGL